jgi:hypothetical protein
LARSITAAISSCVEPAGEIEPSYAEPAEDAADQGLGRCVERTGVDDHVARLHEREQQGGNSRHAGRESERVLRILPEAQPILEDLLVRSVEPRIDQALGAPRTLPRHAFEEALSGRRILEHEGGGEKDGRLQGAFGQGRIEAVPHHQGGGLQAAVVDRQHIGFRAPARGGAGEVGFVFHGSGLRWDLRLL